MEPKTFDPNKTFIVEYDEVEGNVVQKYVPPGYRFIEVYYGGGELCFDANGNQTDDEIFMEAAERLARDEISAKSLKKEYPDVDINPDTDIILAGNTKWGDQWAELYSVLYSIYSYYILYTYFWPTLYDIIRSNSTYSRKLRYIIQLFSKARLN